MMADERRNQILAELARFTGKVVPASFLNQTYRYIHSIERFHYLISGIYKPAGAEYALSIIMNKRSPYDSKDEVIFLEDGRWLMTYSPRIGGSSRYDNRALIKCMEDQVPIAVFRQLTDKRSRPNGSTYQILGLGLITRYDAGQDVFLVEGIDRRGLEQVTSVIPDIEKRYEIELYAQVANSFHLTKEEQATYTVNTQKREAAFREVIISEYDFSCAVCSMKFRFDTLYEVTAAHIVPKAVHGTDDPRNGLALCRSHHWAFDTGIFTITDQYEVQVSTIVEKAQVNHFPLLEFAGKKLYLPESKALYPHSMALTWHRDNVYRS